jgi:hypothetical protein
MKLQLKFKKELAEQELRLLAQVEEWKAEVTATREEWSLKIEDAKRIMQWEKAEFERVSKVKLQVLIEKRAVKDSDIRKLLIEINELKDFRRKLDELKKQHADELK